MSGMGGMGSMDMQDLMMKVAMQQGGKEMVDVEQVILELKQNAIIFVAGIAVIRFSPFIFHGIRLWWKGALKLEWVETIKLI